MPTYSLPPNPFSGEDDMLISYLNRFGIIRPIGSNTTAKSATVVSGGVLTDNPHLLAEIGRKILRTIRLNPSRNDHQPCLIGLSGTGTILSQAAAMMADALGDFGGQQHPICFRAVCGITESQGDLHCWEESTPSPDKHTYWRLAYDDSNIASILQAERELKAMGYPSGPLLIFIKRGDANSERLRQAWEDTVVQCYWLPDIVVALAHTHPDVWNEEFCREHAGTGG